MKIYSINNQLPFESKKQFKKMFKTCTYSGENFEQHDTRTIEHIIPVSEGGKDEYSNYLVVKKSWNEKRSSIPLDVFIAENHQVEKNIKETVLQHQDETIEGINWANEVKKTLKKAIGRNIFS